VERKLGHLERLRDAEIQAVRSLFKPGLRVLELGGGNGYQARQLASWGCEVVSIDVPGRREADEQHYPVQDYDGRRLPFGAHSFDVVFSSNVLEHVKALDEVLDEVRRVLTPEGRAVHVLPTPTWRWWTSLAHYPYLIKYLAVREMPMPGAVKAPTVRELTGRRGLVHLLKRAVVAGPHGEYSSAAAEFYYFSARRWRRLFEQRGFIVEEIYPAGVFHTGYSLMPWLPMPSRRTMARIMGSACKVYRMRLR